MKNLIILLLSLILLKTSKQAMVAKIYKKVQTIPIIYPGGVKLGNLKPRYQELTPKEVKYPPRAETKIATKGIKK